MELSEELVARDLNISVVCSRNSYSSKKKHKKKENLRGINILRVSNISGRERGMVFRILELLTFFITSFFRCISVKKVDFVLVLSSPPFLTILGLIISKLKGAKSVFLIEDVYPDVAIALGFIKKGSFLDKFMTRVNSFLLKRPDRVVVLGEFMKEVVLKNNSDIEQKISIIPNWSDGEKIYPLEKSNNHFVDKFDLKNKFIIQYSGNMGLGHSFETILNGALKLKDHNDIVFLFIGGGPKKKEIIKFKEKHSLSNIKILPYQAYEDLLYSLNACDISLISMINSVDGLIVPSKLYGILASGKPFLFIGSDKNEISDLVKKYNIGRIIEEGKVKKFVDNVLYYYNNRDELKKEGIDARKIFEQKYDKKHAVKKYYDLLMDLCTED